MSKTLFTQFSCEIKGVAPLLMNNPQTVDVMNPYAIAMKEINKKHHTKKTDMDHIKLKRLDWERGLYLDESGRPIITFEMLYSCVVSSSGSQAKFKKGFDIQDNALLVYDGPTDMDAMYGDGMSQFVDYRKVKIGASAVMRARPIFDQWSLTFIGVYNRNVINEKDVVKAVNNAGDESGIGDYRPRYGRFTVERIDFS